MSHCWFLWGHLRNWRRWPTAVAALPMPEEEKGHCSGWSSVPSAPLSFHPPSHVFHVLASCLVMRLRFLLENAVHLLKSLLRSHLKADGLSLNFCLVLPTRLERASACLKIGVSDLAGTKMWPAQCSWRGQKIPWVSGLKENVPLTACSAEENTVLIKQNTSLFCSLLSPLSLFG